MVEESKIDAIQAAVSSEYNFKKRLQRSRVFLPKIIWREIDRAHVPDDERTPVFREIMKRCRDRAAVARSTIA